MMAEVIDKQMNNPTEISSHKTGLFKTVTFSGYNFRFIRIVSIYFMHAP